MLVLRKAPFLAVKLGLPILLLTGFILRSLGVGCEPAAGTYLTPGKAPEAFRTVEEIRGKIGAPKVHALGLVLNQGRDWGCSAGAGTICSSAWS
jgi:hypothetical protein